MTAKEAAARYPRNRVKRAKGGKVSIEVYDRLMKAIESHTIKNPGHYTVSGLDFDINDDGSILLR